MKSNGRKRDERWDDRDRKKCCNVRASSELMHFVVLIMVVPKGPFLLQRHFFHLVRMPCNQEKDRARIRGMSVAVGPWDGSGTMGSEREKEG